MAESATILLPDISGYTEFMTKTELSHSSHIINELLDAILAANTGDFVLSEVEGDALLLYQKGKPIEADALVRQCLSMFERFHTQLKIIERDSLCQCGACKTASNLTLKFIAHHGVVQEIKVRQFTKASGIDMVVAHRLMKNGIASDEYVLATTSCFDCSSLPQSPGALAWQRAHDEYPAIGTIEYQYAPLAGVRSTIADPAPRISPVVELGDDAVAVEIDAPMLEVYQLVIDLDQRPRWLSAVERLDRPATTERIGHAAHLHIPRPDRRVGRGQERYRGRRDHVCRGREDRGKEPAGSGFVRPEASRRAKDVPAVPREVAVQPRAAARDDQRGSRGLQAGPRDDQDALREGRRRSALKGAAAAP